MTNEDSITPFVNRVFLANNMDVLTVIPSDSVDLIYIDPPFNTGKEQVRKFKDLPHRSFLDKYDDFLAFLEPRIVQAHRILRTTGSFYFHIDYREVHYCKLLIDSIFGRDNFINEVIWAYDYGARTTKRWPAKHDNILFYAKDAHKYVFNTDDIDRIPYMAPGLVGPEKAAKGKLPTDTWWHTIVSPTGKEKLGYPTQKPLGVLSRIIRASSPSNGLVLDFFAGSGTTGQAALEAGRNFILVDNNPEAFEVMKKRFENSLNDIDFKIHITPNFGVTIL